MNSIRKLELTQATLSHKPKRRNDLFILLVAISFSLAFIGTIQRVAVDVSSELVVAEEAQAVEKVTRKHLI